MRAGRFVVAPESPSSLKTCLHPAFFKAASGKAVFWSSVETRAEPYCKVLAPVAAAEGRASVAHSDR